MGSMIMNDNFNNTVCTYSHRYYFLDGCCSKRPERCLEEAPLLEPYIPIAPAPTYSRRAHAGKSFLDLPTELRNTIYKLALLTKAVIPLTLNPSLGVHHDIENEWGLLNRCALLATCRESYHQASPIFYGDNEFQVNRGLHRDWKIPHAPGMPFDRISFVTLNYPNHMGPCAWPLSHLWQHWLEDSRAVLRHFPNLKALMLAVPYNAWPALHQRDYDSWEPLFMRPSGLSIDKFVDRVRKVVLALNELNGRRMPKCVCLVFSGYATFPGLNGKIIVQGHDLIGVNVAIPLAWNKDVEPEFHAPALSRS